jgi:hypothetical protein
MCHSETRNCHSRDHECGCHDSDDLFLSKEKKLEFYQKKADKLREKLEDIEAYITELKGV